MRVLIFGGTGFVGRLCVQEALSRGHHVTIFNRGNRPAPDGVTSVLGDRLQPSDLSKLDSMAFNAVIDTWQGDPIAIKTALQTLCGRIQHYVYISSIKVYSTKDSPAPITERSTLWDPDEAPSTVHANKLGGEDNARRSGVPTTVIRPGLILGPGASADQQFPAWLRRLRRGGHVLAPGPDDSDLQFVDGRDLASFVLDAAEQKLIGPFNICSPPDRITWKAFLDAAKDATGSDAQLHWLDRDKLEEAGVKTRGDMPMWLLPDETKPFAVDSSKAISCGLQLRAAQETISDTWLWLRDTDQNQEPSSALGLSPHEEAAILNKYFGVTK